MSYRRRLLLSLGAFMAIILAQSLIALWAFESVTRHSDRSQVSQQMLIELLQFRGDAKLLKIWLAEYLIADKRDTDPRDQLFERMIDQLGRLQGLAERRLAQGPIDQTGEATLEKLDNIELLRGNVETLRQALQTREINRLEGDAERWQTLMLLFDKFQGADIAELVGDSIALQRLRVAQAEAAAGEALRLARVSLLLSVVLALALFIGLGLRLSRHLDRPLQRLLAGTDRIARGEFEQGIPEQGASEFVELAAHFNRMASALRQAETRQRQLQDATEDQVRDRTAQLQQVVGQLQDAEARQQQFILDISHELRTPTTSILGEAELALRASPGDDARRQNLAHIIDCCRQLASRIDDLLMLGRGHHALVSVRLQAESAAAVYARVRRQIEGPLRHHPVQLIVHPLQLAAGLDEDQIRLLVDLDKLDLVCRIITENALQYRCDSSELSLAASLDGELLLIELCDTGLGLVPEELPRLFERHFRGALARRQRPDGLGIGLTIARSLMRAHDGDIRLLPNQPRGARVQLSLPCFDAALAP